MVSGLLLSYVVGMFVYALAKTGTILITVLAVCMLVASKIIFGLFRKRFYA